MHLITYREAGNRFATAGIPRTEVAALRRSGHLKTYRIVGVPREFLDAAAVDTASAALQKRPDLSGLITIEQAADQLHISTTQTDRLIRRGILRVIHRGPSRRRYVEQSTLSAIKPGKCDRRKIEQYDAAERITASAAARVLRLPRPTVRQAITTGALRYIRDQERYMVRIADLLAWHATRQ